MRGAVLGDETAVAMAGCNTSSHCRGWLEGSEHTGSPRVPLCPYVSWHAWWWGTFKRRDDTVVLLFILFIMTVFSVVVVFFAFLIDVVG